MFIESGITTASAMLIVSLADGFNWIITTNRVPKMLSDFGSWDLQQRCWYFDCTDHFADHHWLLYVC